ncbi:MAG: hypothetical protein LBS36_02905 [Oscillospiraceae bacterium]|jgi:hypothetical protein|nr:hypothetical protein [Oscillospiraceae bacterium]
MWWKENKYAIYAVFCLLAIANIIYLIIVAPNIKEERKLKTMPEQVA